MLLIPMVILGIWAFRIEPDQLRLVEHSLTLVHWPAAQSGLRVVVITDLHAGAPFIDEAKVRRVVSMTNAAQPDLILLPGDFLVQEVLGGHPVAPDKIADWLSPLHAPLGVFAVLGNHDYLNHGGVLDGRPVTNALNSHGIAVIDERSVRIQQGRFNFWLSGIEDFVTHDPDFGKLPPADAEKTSILAFTHSPDAFPWLPAHVNLLIAGHTHGGQVRLPFIGAIKTSSRYGRKYQIGHIVDKADLYVCPGIGTSVIPVRFLDPPEICLLTISGVD